MPTFANELAAQQKELCVVWDFPDLLTRFVTRDHSGLSLPGGYTLFTGAVAEDDSGSKIDLDGNSISVGGAGFSVADWNETLTAWLKQKDATLSQAQVTRKEGFIGVSEASYHTTRWVVRDYAVTGKQGGGYRFELDNVLGPMANPLYEDLGDDTFRLRGADDTAGVPAYDLAYNETTVTLADSPKGKWREPGFALLYSKDDGFCELVEYTTIGGLDNAQLQGCTRRKYKVGGSFRGKLNDSYVWLADKTEVRHVWVKRGNPLTIMLELLLTTSSAGSNHATYDLGTGDGLGSVIKAASVDVTGIEAIRTQYWPTPTFVSDTLISGTAILLVESQPIDDLKEFIERNILFPFGLRPALTHDEKFTVKSWWGDASSTTSIGTDWLVDDFSAQSWRRSFADRINYLTLLTDWNPAQGKHEVSTPRQFDPSTQRYGRSKALEIPGRGLRTGSVGFPDYNGLANIKRGATRIFMEGGNPWTDIRVRVPFKYLQINLGDAVTITLAAMPDLSTGGRGISAGVFLVVGRRVNWEQGNIDLTLRLRRELTRVALVAPTTGTSHSSGTWATATYTNSNTTERKYAFLTPGAAVTFGNGDDAYTVVE